MTRLRLLFMCCCFGVVTVTSCITVDGSACVSDFFDTVTCVLNITGHPAGRSGATYSLNFTEEGRYKVSCPLTLQTDHSYSSVCKVKGDAEEFGNDDEYDIKLCSESGCDLVTKGFQPSHNIQLRPPLEPQVQETPETFKVTWESGKYHRYFRDKHRYELSLESTESNAQRLESETKFVLIPRSQLRPGATYCIKVRFAVGDPYDLPWSKWGPSTCWKTEAGREEEQDNTLVMLIKSLVPVCVALGLMLLILLNPAMRMKIKTLSHTPSPAPFFQPLFKQHEGNLQDWFSTQHKLLLAYIPEEILTTDAVIVVPKPVTKEPEEDQDFHNPTVQLAFTQCQTSYVGLPGLHDAPPPPTMVCPGDTSYTQLPCSTWGGVHIEAEAEVVSAPPKDFFSISQVDSGCSCEDLTQDSDCSLPNSPVDEPPTPCYCNDYCVLNKTPEGFAPVMVTKGNGRNVPADADKCNKEEMVLEVFRNSQVHSY